NDVRDDSVQLQHRSRVGHDVVTASPGRADDHRVLSGELEELVDAVGPEVGDDATRTAARVEEPGRPGARLVASPAAVDDQPWAPDRPLADEPGSRLDRGQMSLQQTNPERGSVGVSGVDHRDGVAHGQSHRLLDEYREP